jgi:hypothetical protein
MRRYGKLAGVCGLFLLAMSLTASAGSIDQFKNAALTGVSKGGTVSGSFSFNSKTDQFSNISVSIVSSVFGKINVSDRHAGHGTYKGQGWWKYTWKTKVDGDRIVDSMLFNTITNQFEVGGGIRNRRNQGDFNYISVPEGGTPLSYLMLSGIAMFAGILISEKQRCTRRNTAQSS